MATITYNRPFTDFDVTRAASVSNVTTSTNTHIVFSDGEYSADMSGIFTYNPVSMSGWVSSVTYSKAGQNYLTVSGLNVNIKDAGKGGYYDGNDTYIGSSGNDVFSAWLGNDTYNGGAGRDTIRYTADRSDFVVTANSNATGYTLKGLGKTDTITNIERLVFDDATLALDVKTGENAGSAYRAYQAAFDRKPDIAGLKFWVDRMDAGASLAEVALGFVQSNEFQRLNPATDTNGMINTYYQNVLHRAPDPTGLAFWSNQAANGMQAHEMLAAFSESNENINNTAADIKNGIWLAV